jgi:hypothetical protein
MNTFTYDNANKQSYKLSYDGKPPQNDHIHVAYSNSREYRNTFRKLTNQTTSPPENPFEIDEETIDEQHYDETKVAIFMDTLFEKTKLTQLFQTLYDLAAAQMISTDREIGLAVLCSYDYLSAFYNCYIDFIECPETFSENTPSYQIIKSML